MANTRWLLMNRRPGSDTNQGKYDGQEDMLNLGLENDMLNLY